MRAVLLLALAGCWTGSDTPAAAPAPVVAAPSPHRGFRVRLERTVCAGSCPSYTVTIHGDGRVEWDGRVNVLALGKRTGRVTDAEIRELQYRLDEAQFFERDDLGYLPLHPTCTTANGTTTCEMGGSFSFCANAGVSHTVITATRNYRSHRIDFANCSEDRAIPDLEAYIANITNSRAWIGDEP